MFNQNFYPTPKTLIDKMMGLVDTQIQNDYTILEPSAGKGDLAEALQKELLDSKRFYDETPQYVDVVEIEPELQAILRDKHFHVVGDDFLTFTTYQRYNLIVMNPPFDTGAKHLLKALDLLKHGGQLIALLNAETIKNPYTNERKLLTERLRKNNATIEYLDSAFSDAERQTDVNVALISVIIPEQKGELHIFDKLIKRTPISETKVEEKHDIAINDFVKMIVQQFNNEAEIGLAVIDEIKGLEKYMTHGLDKDDFMANDPLLTLKFGDYDSRTTVTPNKFMYKLRLKYWKALFTNPRVTDKMPSGLLSKFREKLSEFGNYDFNVQNIKSVQLDMSKEIVTGIGDEIIKLFNDLSREYAYDEYSSNIHYFNGFATNKSWYVNNKVIVPRMAYGSWNGRLDKSKVTEYMRNIENILNYLDGGGKIDNPVSSVLSEINFDYQGNAVIKSRYYSVRFYKKGTAHITFTDEDLLKRFNIYVGRHFNWLPPHYGTQRYNDMTPEEKAVIDDFQGKEDYDNVYANQAHYLVDVQNQANLLLPSNN